MLTTVDKNWFRSQSHYHRTWISLLSMLTPVFSFVFMAASYQKCLSCDQRPVLWRGLNIARLCAHDAAQQSPKSPVRVKRSCNGGYQLTLSSPVLFFVLCARSHKRGRLTSCYSTFVWKWIDPGPHILLKMSRLLLCKAMKNSKRA